MNAAEIKKSAKITQNLLQKLADNLQTVFEISDTVNELVETDGGSALTEADLQTLLDAITATNLKLSSAGYALDNNDPAYLRDLAEHDDALKAEELANRLEEEEQRAAEEAARVAREKAAEEEAARKKAAEEEAARGKIQEAAKNPAYLRLLDLAEVSESEDEEDDTSDESSEAESDDEPPVVLTPLTLQFPKADQGSEKMLATVAQFSNKYNITVVFN